MSKNSEDNWITNDLNFLQPQLTAKYGYPSETHKVQTDDGYILTLHRIPYGKKCGIDRQRKPPVLVQHGLLCSSIDWLVMGPELGLGKYFLSLFSSLRIFLTVFVSIVKVHNSGYSGTFGNIFVYIFG